MKNRLYMPTNKQSERTAYMSYNEAIRYDSYKRQQTSPIQPDFYHKPSDLNMPSHKVRMNPTTQDHFYNESMVDYQKNMGYGVNRGSKTPRSVASSQQSIPFTTVSRLDREGIRAGLCKPYNNYNPIVSCNEVAAKKEAYQMGMSEAQFRKPGYKSHTALKRNVEPEIKIGDKGVYKGTYRPETKYNQGKGFKHAKPMVDTLVTLEAQYKSNRY